MGQDSWGNGRVVKARVDVIRERPKACGQQGGNSTIRGVGAQAISAADELLAVHAATDGNGIGGTNYRAGERAGAYGSDLYNAVRITQRISTIDGVGHLLNAGEVRVGAGNKLLLDYRSRDGCHIIDSDRGDGAASDHHVNGKVIATRPGVLTDAGNSGTCSGRGGNDLGGAGYTDPADQELNPGAGSRLPLDGGEAQSQREVIPQAGIATGITKKVQGVLGTAESRKVRPLRRGAQHENSFERGRGLQNIQRAVCDDGD